MNNKNLDSPYCSSPLRRKSLAAAKSARFHVISDAINDDDAERLNRRRRESALLTSTPIASPYNRQSFGASSVAHLNSNQLQEKILQCIQLNTENKITIKNAFSLPAIDILTYFVKMNKEPDLQVASSSLDVSSKVYGLRVDKVYLEVYKMCSNLGKENSNDSVIDEERVNNELENNENEVIKQTRKKRKKINLFSTVESLKGNPEIANLESAISNQDDPQTSDVLNQIQAVFEAKDHCYMSNFNGPVLDTLDNVAYQNSSVYPNPITDFNSIFDHHHLSFPFSFLKWTEDDNSDDDHQFEQSTDMDQEEQANIFHFDIDEVPENIPFPSQDIHMEPSNQKPQENNQFITDFQNSIRSNMINRRSEYTYVPYDLIHFSGPSYWKIVKHRSVNASHNEVPCKQYKKKKVVQLDFETEDIDYKFSSGPRVKCTESTLNAWNEEKLLYYNMTTEFDDFQMFQCFTQSNRYIKAIKKVQKDVVESDTNKTAEDFDCAAMNDECDFNVIDTDNEHFNNIEHTIDQEVLTQGALIGDNLVNAPNLVENIYIPYSKKAKKIDIRQVKKSMLSLLNKKLNIVSNTNNSLHLDNNEVENNSTFKFSNLYKELPKVLTKSNVEAMSVPIAFVSLLHLANEKTLNINSNDSFQDLIIKKG